MPLPHPLIHDGPCIVINAEAVAQAAIAEAMRDSLINTGAQVALRCAIAHQIDRAEAARAGLRWRRGEGGTSTVVVGEFGCRPDVPEQHMNAAQDAFGAQDPVTLARLRDVVRAVRAIDKAALDEAYTTISAEGGGASDTFGRGRNAGLLKAMEHLEVLGARDTRDPPRSAPLQAAE